jgi:dihydropyrimidinase
MDLIIKNAKSVDANGCAEENIWIDKGKIVARVSRKETAAAAETIDAEGRYVIPGAVDSHSHIGQLPGGGHYRPQATREENFVTESGSACMGGTTTAVNYMFSDGSYETVIDDYRRLIEDCSRIDIKLHGGILNQIHVDRLGFYIEKLGLTSFKIFLPYKGEEAQKLGGLTSLDDGQVLDAFAILGKYGAIPIVHCENPELIRHFMAKNQRNEDQSLAAWEATRPSIVEAESVNKILYFAERIGNRIAIAHVSSADSVDIIERYKALHPILETCPHYLGLSSDSELGSLGKVSPPIRSRKDQDRLWKAIQEYPDVVIGSDHNAWQKVHKQELWNGFAGLPNNAFILPLLFTEGVGRRNIPIEDIVRISSVNPARLFGLFPRKGSLSVGADADIVVMDTGINRKVAPGETGSISDYSPFADYVFSAWPSTVIIRGEVAVHAGSSRKLKTKSAFLNARGVER